MHRVTSNNGYVVAFAEPDYGGRIDYPPEFIKIRDFQIKGLKKLVLIHGWAENLNRYSILVVFQTSPSVCMKVPGRRVYLKRVRVRVESTRR